MPEVASICIPLENTNDETVRFLGWLVEDGAKVRDGESIAEVETSKAVVELTAPASGKILLAARAGEEVAIGAVVGYVGSEASLASCRAELQASLASSGLEAPPACPGTRFSKKALELIERHRLSPESFADWAMVRESEVLEFLEEARATGKAADNSHFALRAISLKNVSLPSGVPDTDYGRLDPQFLEYVRQNTEVFGRLSSDEKCEQYRSHGAVVGTGVTLGAGTVILTPQLVLGDGVQIGKDVRVRCWKRFVVGQLSSFGEAVTVAAGDVVVGDNVFAGSRIEIAGGGKEDPWSLLCVGDTTFLGDEVRLDVHRPVVIGREVFLAERAALVTHNIGHSILEGYENTFEPIVLEDFCQVGMFCTVYAGTRIGRSAVVASNSYVISCVPEGKLAMGVPAHVIRDAARPLDRKRQVQIAQKMVRDYHELLMRKGFDVSPVKHDRFTLMLDGKSFQLAFSEIYPDRGRKGEKGENVVGSVIWTLESTTAPAPGCTLFHLLAKRIEGPSGVFVDSTREFLRKRGIRFHPGPWRYRQGLI